MTYQYDHSHYDPPAPVIRVTVRSPAGNARQVTIDALVDTGADVTCLPSVLIKAVGGEPASTYSVFGINGVFVALANSYFLEFEIASTKKLAEAVAVGDEAILGRNLINEFILQMHGRTQTLTITSD